MSSSSVGATRLPPFTPWQSASEISKSEMLWGGGSEAVYRLAEKLEIWEYFLGCFGEIAGEWICLGVED